MKSPLVNHYTTIQTAEKLAIEIQAHFSKEGKVAFELTIQAIFKEKQIRGCDYRDA